MNIPALSFSDHLTHRFVLLHHMLLESGDQVGIISVYRIKSMVVPCFTGCLIMGSADFFSNCFITANLG